MKAAREIVDVRTLKHIRAGLVRRLEEARQEQIRWSGIREALDFELACIERAIKEEEAPLVSTPSAYKTE